MKIKMKMKNKSHKYDINRHKPIDGQKYSKHELSQYNDTYVY